MARRRVRVATAQLAGREPPPVAPRAEPAAPLVELASSLDPEDVLDRTLDQIVALPGIDAALISLEGGTGGNGRARTQAAGLTEDEIERTLLHMPAHADLRALEVVYRYRLEDVNETSRLPRSALDRRGASGGRDDRVTGGDLRSSVARFSAEAQDALEALARRAGPAIWNALRYTEARELAELDPLTGLHNRRLFYEFLAREIARARRYERHVSLIVFDLDDFKRINDRIGHPAGDACCRDRRLRSKRRPRDRHPLPLRGDEFCVIVPESSRDDAELLGDRIAHAIRQQKVEKVGALKVSAGVAELRPDDTPADLFKRADEALLRAKGDGKGRIVATRIAGVKQNRSIPSATVIPVLIYPDVRAAVAWLSEAFGFGERLQIGEDHRSQLEFGDGRRDRRRCPPATASHPGRASRPARVMIRVEDARRYCEQARAAGAEITMEPTDFEYGERQWSCADPWGHQWTFSETLDDVDPASWGGLFCRFRHAVSPTSRACPTPCGKRDD